ncbi:mitochondrial solute carrier family 25 (mitochondrial phosphate transporter) member 23/24/25/41 [Andalucia godoyi]|uniref:Mitochondrial solute carrier family 25 (Mitochondrial phosphate transporter) member 23/24/25/41 n=1 Tax=Andalucia godoyi TaxID=505711 RepID=A0A8K0F437_ANDGO|nr:mitochondrial solute carrier family 25 (mitochondrial phosphate transporter) member 23/24/25/41 [Andalucia godoyi]|eukprot:ANDGO_00904.mRNA.1 mitochondrial solute carrier family 25 (mitochondrial phosphate transporter) member 23/24/25/41
MAVFASSPAESEGEQQSQPQSFAALRYLAAGAVSGAVSRTMAAPVERLKIVFQVQHVNVASNLQKRPQFQGIIPSLIAIGKQEGWRGYFKGNGVNVVRIIPYSSVQFFMYEEAKTRIRDWENRVFASSNAGRSDGSGSSGSHGSSEVRKPLSTVGRLLAGSVAGVVSVMASYPLDVVRCRLSAPQGMNPVEYKGIADCLVTMYRTEGPMSLWRGMAPTVMGIAPYAAINFAVYEQLKRMAYEWNEKRQPGRADGAKTNVPVWQRLALGAVAGMTAQTATYPFDTVRRRMQMRAHYTSTWNAMTTIFHTEGVRGLYRGLVPNYLKVVPVVSVGFVVYEWSKVFFGIQGKSGEL